MHDLSDRSLRILKLMHRLHGKQVTVVGLGRSGLGAVRLLSRYGARIRVTDTRAEPDLQDTIRALPQDVSLFLGGHPAGLLESSDLVVVSPGVPLGIEALRACRERGTPVIGELELCARVTDIPFIAITGTNGKSTVTSLVGEILRRGGVSVFVGGNIGVSLCDGIVRMKEGELTETDWIVAEVSSFQLETTEQFKPRIASILNMSPDHMDRYDSPKDYLDAKARIFLSQDAGDHLVLNADDESVSACAAMAHGNVAWFSRRRRISEGVFLSNGDLVWRLGNASGRLLPWGEIRIRGVHNLENAMAASCMALLAGIRPDDVADTLREFPGLEHRLEFVAEVKGVTYVNDSKATNTGAVEKSLESFSEPLVLIAGGRAKKTDFSALRDLVGRHVKALVLIGESAKEIAAAVGEGKPVSYARSMEQAVLEAARHASAGDVVLLAPACASFDMFRDFEDRGRVFKDCVRKLRDETVQL